MLVAETTRSFRASAKFDDELMLVMAVAELGRTRIQTRHRIYRDSELLVEADMRHVVVDLATPKKTPIPDWLRTGLVAWDDGGPSR
jgi:acyl-CoA thioesterase FadM